MPLVDARSERIAAALGGRERARWFRAPGRVNLIGDHTDYNEGLVLPIAIDRDCLVAVSPREDGRIRARSLDLPPGTDTVEIAADGSDEPRSVEPAWGRYVAGVVRVLAELGRRPLGAEAVCASTVPRGSGLSSSAALEVAFALALAEAAELAVTRRELAAACQRGELIATGVPVGIMDQLVSLEAVAGAALLIDCRSLDTRPVELPTGVEVVAVHSGLPRELRGSAYAERRAACEAAARRLGLRALRDATPEQVADDPIARHVVSENGRVLEATRALEAGDLEALGGLLAASHASLRDDYRVSTRELDLLVEALVDAGAIGARLTGAGFGGCVVALVEQGRGEAVAGAAASRYRAATGLEPTPIPCRPAPAAAELRPAA